MKKIVVVLGTSHPIQKGEKGDKLVNEFKSFLKNICDTNNIKMIAEEINENANFIIAQDLCQELEIKHKIIDPNPNQYKGLGIKEYDKIFYEVMDKHDLCTNFLKDKNTPSNVIIEFESKLQKEHFHPREVEWLRRIQEDDMSPILVIFGANHFESFSKLLFDNNIEVIKSDAYWGKGM